MTPIGLALGGLGGVLGAAADRFGQAPVLLGFAAIATLGAILAPGLDEVQQD